MTDYFHTSSLIRKYSGVVCNLINELLIIAFKYVNCKNSKILLTGWPELVELINALLFKLVLNTRIVGSNSPVLLWDAKNNNQWPYTVLILITLRHSTIMEFESIQGSWEWKSHYHWLVKWRNGRWNAIRDHLKMA